jgi:hypothetical protein
MLSTNSYPKTEHTDISLYYTILDDKIYSDAKFIELMNIVNDNPTQYIYSLYTETCLLKNNIYVPVFHTLYLSSKHHNVIINNEEEAWLSEVFPNNTYYIIKNENETFDYGAKNIISISSIKEIG